MSDKFLNNDADIAKVVGKGELITVDMVLTAMDLPSGERPRIYAYLSTGPSAGSVIGIRSGYDVHVFSPDVQFYWLSGVTAADLITRA